MLRYNKEQKYILFDWETENLNLVNSFNKGWQLSYIVCQGYDILSESDNYIKWPDLNISADAARVTHFDRAKYDRLALPPEPILDEFEKYLYDPEYLILGHNILNFDVYLNNIARKLIGRQPDFSYIPRCIDTNSLAKAIAKGIKLNKDEDLICWQYRLCDFREKGLKTSMISLLKKYKIDFDENRLHDGLYDAKQNWEVFKKQIWEIEI